MTTDSNAEFVESNRRLWNGWTGLHVDSDFYNVEGFCADPASRPLDSIEREVVGDIAGKRLLHLQCHFGLDSLRLALQGAQVTGVDFSADAIAAARALASRTGIDATFVESDVRSLPVEVPEGGYDIVYTSYGVLSWLPDLRPWAASVASRLAPGGRVCIIEAHPALWVFDEERSEPPLALRWEYFGKEPVRCEERGSYAAPEGDFEGVSYSWQHTFEATLMPLIAEGLVIESLREYPKIAWRHVPFMVQDAEGFWELPKDVGDIPLMFSLVARKRE